LLFARLDFEDRTFDSGSQSTSASFIEATGRARQFTNARTVPVSPERGGKQTGRGKSFAGQKSVKACRGKRGRKLSNRCESCPQIKNCSISILL
jgi:hypothetical protein